MINIIKIRTTIDSHHVKHLSHNSHGEGREPNDVGHDFADVLHPPDDEPELEDLEDGHGQQEEEDVEADEILQKFRQLGPAGSVVFVEKEDESRSSRRRHELEETVHVPVNGNIHLGHGFFHVVDLQLTGERPV